MAQRSNRAALKSLPVGQWGAREAGILDVARKLYAERGYEKVSMADVALAAGLSEGTLYNYFHDKNHLVLSVALAGLQNNIDVAKRIAREATCLRSGLQALIAHQLRSLLATPEMYRIWLREVKTAETYGRSGARNALRSFSSHFVTFLDRWITPGMSPRTLDQTMMRDIFYGGIEQVGWTVIVQNRRRTFDIDDAAVKLANAYIAAFGLAAPAPSPLLRSKPTARAAKKIKTNATL